MDSDDATLPFMAADQGVHRSPSLFEWSDDRYLGGAVAFSVRNSVMVNALSRTPRT